MGLHYNSCVTRLGEGDERCEPISALGSTGFFTLLSYALHLFLANMNSKKITRSYKKLVFDFFIICKNLGNKGVTSTKIKQSLFY